MYARTGHARASAWSIWRSSRTGCIWTRPRELGGHAGAIAQRLDHGDWFSRAIGTRESLELARENTAEWWLADTVSSEFRSSDWKKTLRDVGISQLDGLLADLGVSRYQLTEGERGFSLMTDGPLDMRMDRSQGETAADLVNYESEKELADLIYKFGEERRSRKIARAIVRARPITTTGQLAKLIEGVAPRTQKFTRPRRRSWRCGSR